MIKTRLTEFFEIEHPVIQAPMAGAAGGKLAAAVSQAGGMGFIGGAYCDPEWIEEQFGQAGNQAVGCGFITWRLEQNPGLLTNVLAKQPQAVFLSFADPKPFADEIHDSGTPLICQVQTLEYAKRAVDCGAQVIVAQGSEAGGHGAKRGTFPLVPEIADFLSAKSPDTLLCAAGGVGDGRGLAASLMLGADGAVVGSRFWASSEALVHPGILKSALDSSGDETIRTSVVDIIRRFDWPAGYNCRVLLNDFTAKWHDDMPGLKENLETEISKWEEALQSGNASASNTIVGEVTGLIRDVRPAADILRSMVAEAEELLKGAEASVL